MTSVLTRPIRGADAWSGSEMARTDAWRVDLPADALDQIDEALEAFRARGLPLAQMRKADFPVPALQPVLQSILHDLEHGRGFVQMKGLRVGNFSAQDAEIVYWGIGLHLGAALSQNSRGDLLGHVRDEGLDIRDTRVRGYQTNAGQSFHTDIGGDVVGLMCLHGSESGGRSRLASSMAIYNALLERFPHYVGLLYNGFDIDWRGEQPEGSSPVYREPIYSYFDDRLSCRFAPRFIRSARDKTGVPLSSVEREALQLMEDLAEELCFEIPFEPGDIQLINNYVTLHGRTAYVDYPERDRRRHLLRLWLKVPGARTLPPEYGEGRARLGVPARARPVGEVVQW
jgi:hypothetical protein